jgi:hypothetical protein
MTTFNLTWQITWRSALRILGRILHDQNVTIAFTLSDATRSRLPTKPLGGAARGVLCREVLET